MKIVFKILKSVWRKLDSFFAFVVEGLIAIFSPAYRISFRNFWYSGERQREIWFYPLIQDLYKEKDPTAHCRISPFFPHVEMLSVLGNPNNLRGSRAQAKVFFSGECVRSAAHSDWLQYSDYRLGVVDLAIGFDHEATVRNPKYLRFPLWILFFFSCLDSKDEIARKIASLNERRFAKTKFCSLIARHDANGVRTEIFTALSTIDRVDCGGRLLNNDDRLAKDYQDDKAEYLKQYKFNICPENTQGNGYVTEKLFQAFESGCIPIYNGDGDDPEPDVINKDAIIYWGQNGENENAISLVRRIQNDPKEYEAFLNRPRLKETATDFVWDSMTRLRERLGAVLPLRKHPGDEQE